MRETLRRHLERPLVRDAIIGVIILNAVVLGLETSAAAMAAAGPLILAVDRLCLAIFTIELGAKLVAYRRGFFRSGWNLFDAAIVGVSYAPAGEGLSVLRALRILRVLRVISVAPRLRRVVEGFVTALPGMGSVFLLMAILFYIGGVMAAKLFGAAFPEWFGTLGRSLYSLFQIMTLESWSMGIVRPVMEIHPYAWAFFVPFILVTTFAVVNLLVGLIVNSMQEAHGAEGVAATEAYRDEVLERLRAIEARLAQAEAAPVGRASEAAPVGRATEAAPVGRATEAAPVGRATEAAPVGRGGDTEPPAGPAPDRALEPGRRRA